MTVSQATARQPSLITPLNKLLSVLDLTGEIIKFVIMSSQGSDISQMTIALVNAAPCRLLARGKESIDVESCVNKNRETRKFNSKLNFYKLIPYLVDRCICPAPCRSRQTLEKNVLSWALAGTGSVLFTRQVAVQPTCRYTAHACACALPLFVVYLMTPCWL